MRVALSNRLSTPKPLKKLQISRFARPRTGWRRRDANANCRVLCSDIHDISLCAGILGGIGLAGYRLSKTRSAGRGHRQPNLARRKGARRCRRASPARATARHQIGNDRRGHWSWQRLLRRTAIPYRRSPRPRHRRRCRTRIFAESAQSGA